MNAGISYLFIRVLTLYNNVSLMGFCIYILGVLIIILKFKLALALLTNRELLCYGLQKTYFALTHYPFYGLVNWTMNRIFIDK